MKKIFLRVVAVALVLAVVFSSNVYAVSQTDGACTCEHCPSIVVPGLFQSDVMYLDENGNDMLKPDGTPYSAPFFLEPTDEIVKLALEEAILPLGKLLITQQDKENRCANAIADVAGQVLLGNLELDQYGKPIKNIQPDRYMTSFANLTQEQVDYALNKVPLDLYVDIAGLDHLYFCSYIHTGNIKDAAKDLYDIIQIAKKETGHDKVNLVPLSQGGSIQNALMQYYIDNGLEFADDVNRVCYVVPAADGAYVLGDIYRYGFLDDPEALYGYLLPSILGADNQALAYGINLALRIFPEADLNNMLDIIVDRLIEDYLEYSTCLWGLIPSRDYPALREKFLSDPEDVYIREQTDWYYNAQLNSRKYILDAQSKGVEFFDIVNYNAANYKIFDSWNTENGDGVIHCDSESFGATTVSVNVSLADDYKQANTYCTNPEHNHIDEDRLIDASTGIMCDRTFYFKNQGHESTADNDVIIRLAIRILTDPSFEDVYSDPAFPQFNYARISRKIVAKYNEWKDFDASTLSSEDAAAFNAALEKLGKAVESTYMPTEEFNAANDEFDAVIYKIENGKEKKDSFEDVLNDVLTQILKFISDTFVKVFGAKGYSEFWKIIFEIKI